MTQKTAVIGGPLLSPSHVNPFRGSRVLPTVLSDRQQIRFFFSGSHAVWNGIQALKLPSDRKILFPAYHCGAELDAVLKAGYSVQFYNLDGRLQIDLESVRKAIDETTGALFLIHYFGFPQAMEEVQAFCRERSLLLIEDCAHALYSAYQDRPLGTFGEMAVFSLRKYLPIPEGGALRMNRGIAPPEEGASPPRDETLRMLKREVERTVRFRWGAAGRLGLSAAKRVIGRSKGGSTVGSEQPLPKSLDPSIDFPVETGHWGISPLSHRILSRIDHLKVIRRRSENFKRLAASLRSCRTVQALFDDLPEGVCPWMFPIWAEEPRSLVAHLQAAGMEVALFWTERHPAFPMYAFPEVSRLRDQVVALPIHQDLNAQAMIDLSERIHSWKR